MKRISLEQEIETNIQGSNDCFSNTRYLRLIENQINVSIILMKEIICEPKLIFFFQNPGTITKLIYHSWYKNKCDLVNLIMEKISLEHEIETNIPGSNGTFSNSRYLRLIEN